MSRAEDKLADVRAARDAARAAFDRQLVRARTDLQPAAIRQRIVADARHKAMEVATEAIEIANDSRGVVIATGAALALWLARKPIGRAVTGMVGKWLPPPDQADRGTTARTGDWLSTRIVAMFGRKPLEDSNDDKQ